MEHVDTLLKVNFYTVPSADVGSSPDLGNYPILPKCVAKFEPKYPNFKQNLIILYK